MKDTNWKDIAELVGVAAIVASLIFVGLQMRQSHEIALADQYQSRSEAVQDLYISMYEAGYSMRDGLNVPLVDQEPRQRDGTIAMVLWQWTQYDNHHYQYSAGYLENDAWVGLSKRVQSLYDKCDRRRIWEDYKYGMRSSFIDYVDSLEDRCPGLE